MRFEAAGLADGEIDIDVAGRISQAEQVVDLADTGDFRLEAGGFKVFGQPMMKEATVDGSDGRKARPCQLHQVSKLEKSEL